MADRVFKNGAVYTVDQNRRWAQGIAIAGGKIILVGNNEEVEQLIGQETDVVDLNGTLVLPGFIDAHSHPSHGMDYFSNINSEALPQELLQY